MLNFRWLKNNKGQGMVEYILIIVVVIGIVLVAYKWMGEKTREQFIQSADTIATASEERVTEKPN